ncbi:MAG TPA: hypothetical protein ENO12_02015 [Thermoplasmatales archaeon]|nr:hypothetical protein [Thermoplasmatales archaeon]
MSLAKVIFLTSLLLISSFSGCILLRQTHFSVLSLLVDDDNGFPRIVIEFNTSDIAVVTLADPQQTLLFSDTYYSGVHNESMYLSNYRTSVAPGTYRLQVVDASKNTIFENELRFNGANISLVSLSVDGWTKKTSSSIVTLHLTFKNSGDLPAYPNKLIVHQGTTVVETALLPSVVLPSDTTQITCFVPLPERTAEETQLTISVLDNKGTTLVQSSPTILNKTALDSWDYTWFYFGQHTLSVPRVDWFFDYYKSLDRFDIVDYSAYVFDPYDDQYIEFLVYQILSLKDLRSNVEIINFLASFVQSIEYKNDDPENASYEYPRYPLETLREQRGDCEDKAILTAALLGSLGYNISLLRLPQHMAVGVHLNETIPGYSYYIDQYYFLETTALHMTLGRVPSEYQGLTNVTVYPISQRPLLIHRWKSATRYQVSTGEDYVHVKMILENLGTAATSSVEIRGAFYDDLGQFYNLQTMTILPIAAGEKQRAELYVDIPTALNANATTLKTQVFIDGTMVHKRESTSRFP